MTSINAAQAELLSSAPATFSFSNPPAIGWWKAKFNLDLPAAVFLYHYQSTLGTKASARDGTHWEVGFASDWQAAAGITPKQWEGVRVDLGASGTQLLSFSVRVFKAKRGTWIRPSEQLLGVFGVTLQIYDAVAGLDWEISRQLSPSRGPAAAPPKPLTHEELDALALWAARGGLARMRNAEHLGKHLEVHNSASDGP
jgi:hypothetical protein